MASKILENDLLNKGVLGMADKPGLSAKDMQYKFEEIQREIIIPKLNEVIGEVGSMLSPFDNEKTYAVGEYCIYKDELYKCIDAVTIPGTWNDKKWGVTTLSDALKDLQSQVDNAIKESANAVAEEAAARKAEIAIERARIDSIAKLPEGSTTGDAELIDGRVDYKGNTHTNIGEHIREVSSQLSSENAELKSDLDDKFVGGKNLIDVNKIQNGKNISSDGRIVDDSNFEITNKIRLSNGETLRVSNNGTSISVLFVIYKNDGTFVERKNLEYFTATYDCYVILRFYNNYIETRKYIQAEINDVITYYEPYYQGIKRYEDKLFITPEDFGAIGDGVSDDTIPIQNAIRHQQKTRKEIRFSKTYIVSSPLDFESVMYLNIEPNSVIKANPSSQMDYLINFNTTQHDEWTWGLSQGSYIIGGGTIDCNGKVKDAIRLSYYYGLRIHDIFVKNFTSRGIITGMYGDIGGHLDMNNVEFDNTNMLLLDTIGIYNNRTDNTFYNIRCRDVQTGVWTNNDGNFNEVHCWIIRTALWEKSTFCVLMNARAVFFVKPYCDTMRYGFVDGSSADTIGSSVIITDIHYRNSDVIVNNELNAQFPPKAFVGIPKTEFRVFGGLMVFRDGDYFANTIFNKPIFMDIRFSQIDGIINNNQIFSTYDKIKELEERIKKIES